MSAGGLPATFSVPAANPAGVSTGIAVNAGDVLSFTATGTWCWETPTFCSDANGTPGRPGPTETFDTVIPTSYFGTLIGSVNGTYFPIGSSATLMMPASGMLVLLMNDRTCCYGDNSGSISVTVAAATSVPTTSEIQVSPAALSFTAAVGGDAAYPQTVTILAAGTTAANFAVTVDAGTAGSAAPSWLSVGTSSGATPGALIVTANPGTMAAGTYSATIHIAIAGNIGQPINVQVTFTIATASPQLQVSPSSLSFGAHALTPSIQTQAIMLRNSAGGGSINFSAAFAGQSTWASVSPASGKTAQNSPVTLMASVNSQGLAVGNYHDILQLTWNGGVIDIPVSLFVTSQGAILSVGASGVLFEARQGNGLGRTQSVSVFNLGDSSTTVNWTASLVSGADWAILGGATGSSTPNTPGSFSVSVGGDVNSLPVGGAYALIKITDSNAQNSPQYVTAVLSIESANNPAEPYLAPGGLYFTNSTAAQTVSIFTSSNSQTAFQASASTTDGAMWLTVTPASGTTSTQTPGAMSISVSSTGLANGVYTGNVNVSENGIIRSVNVTFVVTGTTTAPQAPHATGCTPSHLALTQTALSSNFQVPAGWPATMIVQLNDDCGNPVSNGSVVASFSNGDPPLTLPGDEHTNMYSATWQPGAVSPSMTVTISAVSGALPAVIEVFPGAVQTNTFAPPTLIPGGALHIFFNVPTAQALGYGLAPGNVAQVYGTGMASVSQSPNAVPLVNAFNGTFLLIGAIQAPLYYVSPGLLDVQIPAELAPNQQYAAVLSANGALSLPETITLVPEQPGMAANADGTVIAQHAVDYSLVTAAHPAKPGEPLIIYLAGMGATNPPVASGAVTPSALVPTIVQPTMSVDGQPAAIAYAGLTPDGIGLYQINFTVPTNARSGNLNLVVIQGNQPSNTTTLPVSN
jgi:uncharacterized protein (TIGR03437 family)